MVKNNRRAAGQISLNKPALAEEVSELRQSSASAQHPVATYVDDDFAAAKDD